ncbi:hypothetical protein [Cellulomonas sp. GbtcB1]|uniref:hypothetical protein n=1 Tax=Cellulomonas sp. GbtcB1 TaxID=2824746 RepID=UPI001C2F5152|nr:hypothetical protein [Cellulomonas sp. GbtcB1]
MADLAGVAADLYGVPPAGFTGARTAAVKAARSGGERDLARAVGALRKPSSAAAAVNLLVRERPDDLGALLDLGVRIREAQAALAGADLRALHAEQQRAVGAAADAALALLGGGAGGAVRGQVEATLRAAMGDPDAAAAVATGLLVRDLFSSGFEPVDVEGAVAVPGAPALAGAPARRTPLRAVPDDAGAAADGSNGERDVDAPTGAPPGRRRGRLLTEEEPRRPLRAAPAGRRSRVRVADEDEPGSGGGERTEDAGPGDGEGTGGPGETVSLPGRRRRGRVRVQRDRQTQQDRRAEQGRRAEQDRQAEQERSAARRAAAEREARAQRRAAAVRAAEQDVALARDEADERRGARDAADDRLHAVEARAEELDGTIARAREEIERLRAALASAEQESRAVGLEVRHARSARTAAARQAERAEQRLRAAEAARDAL